MKKKKLIIIVTSILLVGLIIIIGNRRKLTFIEKGIKDGFSFIVKGINIPINFFKEEIEKSKAKGDLYEENKKLKEKIDEMKLLEVENIELKNNINSLKEILNLNDILSEYTKVPANVISRNFGYWYDSLIIDKGTNDGIKENQAVITGNGLIGYIESTNYKTSTVKLITSELENKISVKIYEDDKETFGILTGYKDGYFIIEGVTENVEKDFLVTTAGLGNNYPEGIYIGKVDEIVTDNFGLIKNLKVKSDINYDLISIVSVIVK